MKTSTLMPLSGAIAVVFMSAVTLAKDPLSTNNCRILQGSTICPSIQYLTNVEDVGQVDTRIQGYFQGVPTELSNSASSCMEAIKAALCLLEFPKCQGQTDNPLPVCLSVRDHVVNVCFKQNADATIIQEQINTGLSSPLFTARWAASDSVQEPDCVSLQDHGLGVAPLENIRMVNDVDQDPGQSRASAATDQILKERDIEDMDEVEEDIHGDLVKSALKNRHLSRRERVKHHHHHNSQQQHHHHQPQQSHHHQPQQSHHHQPQQSHHHQPQQSHHHHHEKRVDTPKEKASVRAVEKDETPILVIRADQAKDQSVYTVSHEKESGDGVLLHKSINKGETEKGQKVLIQGGSRPVDPSDTADSLAKANAGQANAVNATKEAEDAASPHKGTVLLAAVPILLIMGAIAGFTIYRRFYENSFNEGGRNDTHDDYPGDGYYQRDIPIRKGSPIHFDRTFLNTPHSPPRAATYLHDPENGSRNQSPSSIASVTMKRPPPSAGSFGKTRFQELSRSYDFGAGFRTIKNVLTRSNNNSRDGALDKATGPSGSSGSLSSKSVDYAFGAGGHSIAKIGSHPGLTVLERQQLQQQYGANSGSTTRFPDMKSLNVSQEQSIVWGQYSADDDGVYQDASSAVASNMARKSASSTSLSHLSGGKYSHHYHQSSGHQPDNSSDSIGDCLAPESPSMTRAGMMRHRALHAEGYSFDSEKTGHSTDLLFDARDNFLNFGVETVHEAALRDEEIDMYLSMEKEESPFPLNDYNTMNPTPYEPKVLARNVITTGMIQKTAALTEKESYPSQPTLNRPDEEFDEKKAMEAEYKAATATAPVHLEVPEQTHVLGCESPEWNPDEASRKNDDKAPVAATFDQVQAQVSLLSNESIINTSEIIADEPLDLREWEEGSSVGGSAASLPQMVGNQQTQSHSKKKGNKSKSKKGRR